MMPAPLLVLERVSKIYRRGLLDRAPAFRLEDRKGAKSIAVPGTGRRSINFVAGEGPTVQGMFRTIGVPAAAQMYGWLSGEGPKAVASLKVPKAAPAGEPTDAGWKVKLTWGLIGAAFTYLLWFRGLSRLEPSAVSPLGFLSPVVAILLGWGVLGEQLTPVQALGILVVFASVWLSQRAQLLPKMRPARA